jgi:hypothetical protein
MSWVQQEQQSIGTSESYTKSLLGVSAVLRVDDWFKNANTLF